MINMGQTPSIQSVDTAFKIVESLLELDGATVTEVAQAEDIPVSTAHDYLKTLHGTGYVVKESEEYYPGTRFLKTGNQARYQRDIFRTSEPELEELAIETGEYSLLMVEERGLGVVFSLKEGNKASNVNIQQIYPGTRTYLNSTAPGKAILAHLSEEVVDAIIDEHGLPEMTDQTITDPDTLDTELIDIRDRGFALDDQERFDGMRGIGVPILRRDETVEGAISLYGPANRLSDSVFDKELPKKVLEVANVVHVNLKYS